MPTHKDISVDEVFNLFVESGSMNLIDVREEDEFAQCSATLSRNIPLSQLKIDSAKKLLGLAPEEPLYVICRSGRRSAAACQIFMEAGYRCVYNVTGGMESWRERSLPVRC